MPKILQYPAGSPATARANPVAEFVAKHSGIPQTARHRRRIPAPPVRRTLLEQQFIFLRGTEQKRAANFFRSLRRPHELKAPTPWPAKPEPRQAVCCPTKQESRGIDGTSPGNQAAHHQQDG